MQIGLFGLGRMGANMARRWKRDGHDIIVCNRSKGPIDELMAEGLSGVYTIEELIAALKPPRAIWVMIPSGTPTDEMIQKLLTLLQPGDNALGALPKAPQGAVPPLAIVPVLPGAWRSGHRPHRGIRQRGAGL